MEILLIIYFFVTLGIFWSLAHDLLELNFVEKIKHSSLILAWPIVGVIFIVFFVMAIIFSLVFSESIEFGERS